MLVLSRMQGESLVFDCGGERVVLTVGRVDRGTVRLVMSSDKSKVRILRAELLDRYGDSQGDLAEGRA